MSITYTTPQGVITKVKVATRNITNVANIVADLILAGARMIRVR